MTRTNTFDVKAWLDVHFEGALPLEPENLEPILYFSLIWNLFEAKTCNRYARPESIRQSTDRACERGLLHLDKYQPFLDFFRSRYVKEGVIADSVFTRLELRNQEGEQAIRDALLENSHDLNNLVYALLLIAWRVRNNLFHGNKGLKALPRQLDLFHTINHLLATYLDDILKPLPDDSHSQRLRHSARIGRGHEHRQ